MTRACNALPLIVFCTLTCASSFASANWVSDGLVLCTATGNQTRLAIASDGAGGAIVTWVDGRNEDNDIYAQRVNASGGIEWATDGVVLSTATGHYQYTPTIVSDGAGGAIVAWGNSTTGHTYAQRVNGSGAVQWTANGVALCTAPGEQSTPTIASDGAGGAIVTWRDDGRGSYSDIYAQRLNASGTAQWTTDGVALCTATGNQQSPQITSDGAGGAVVTWMDGRSGSYDIYAQRVNASGAVQWTANGVALCTAPFDQQYPTIASDGECGAIVTWWDHRIGGYGIYAQSVSASGAVQWTTDGVAICTTGFNRIPVVISDEARGAIVTWESHRSGADFDIYTQRVNASGSVQWTTDGVSLCSADGDQLFPGIVSDGAEGAIVTWEDGGPFSYDVYAQRVNASGAVQWGLDGVGLCTATGSHEYPTIVSDGAGGAIVAWEDYRGQVSGYDIYAQRVDPYGFPVLTSTAMPVMPVELRQNYPNPFNPTTTITYFISEWCKVTLEIYDISGECVARLVDRQQDKGTYSVMWNANDKLGNPLASGLYLYRLMAGGQTISRKMVLLR